MLPMSTVVALDGSSGRAKRDLKALGEVAIAVSARYLGRRHFGKRRGDVVAVLDRIASHRLAKGS